jgi:hypothetical protein
VRGRECSGGVLREEKGCACEEDGGNARLGTRKAKKGKGEWGQLDTRPSGEKKGVGGVLTGEQRLACVVEQAGGERLLVLIKRRFHTLTCQVNI